MSELVTVSLLTVQPGKRDAVIDALRDDLEGSHREDGVLRFALSEVIGQPDQLVVIEVYRSRADLDFHYTTPHFANIKAKLPGLLTGPVTVIHTTPLPIGDPVKGVLD